MVYPPDPKRPNVARMYDFALGGKDNFQVDRETWQRAVEADPTLPTMARENRGFVRRATAFMAGQGVDQFLDLGSGLPTQRNVHEIAHEVDPDAHTVYVDYDPVVKAHGDALLARDARSAVFQHDLRDVDAILRSAASLLDFSRPVGVLCTAVLHFIGDDDDPWAIMARLRQAIAPGSYLALTHASADERPEEVARVAEIYKQTSAPGTPRTWDQVAGFFGEFAVVDPGLVWVPAWRPETPVNLERAADVWIYAGVARKAVRRR